MNIKSTALQIFSLLTIVLILILALNYFNLLSLSQWQPKTFGFLPHKPYLTSITSKNINAVPTPTVFPYDSQKAKDLLTQYIKNMLKPEFIPTEISVEQSLTSSGKKEGTPYEFGANWNIKKTYLSANFHYIQEKNQVDNMELFMKIDNIDNRITPEITSKIISEYFVRSFQSNDFVCNKDPRTQSIYFCEHFSSENDQKNGIGLVIINNPTSVLKELFTCRFFKESIYYRQESCLPVGSNNN